MTKNIYLIIGESGTGKDAVVDAICKKHHTTKVISYTTRDKRPAEGNTHIFVTDTEFNHLENIVAYTKYNGYQYCATQRQVEQADFYIIDVAGIEYFKENYYGNKPMKIIYITASDMVRYERMTRRKNTIDEACMRIQNDIVDFKNAKNIADIIIYNYSFSKCVSDVWEYVQAQENAYA